MQGQVIHLYGKITQLGKHPRLDDAVDLIPMSGDAFKDARVGQVTLVRGFSNQIDVMEWRGLN